MKNLNPRFFLILVILFTNIMGTQAMSNEESSNEIYKPLACWDCIFMDAIGMYTGASAGSVGGPIGAAVGGAVVGAYLSIKENKAQATPGSPQVWEDDVTENTPFDQHGINHNKILDAYFRSNVNIEDLEAFYNLAVTVLKNRPQFRGVNFQENIKTQTIAILQKTINEENTLSWENDPFLVELETAAKITHERGFITNIRKLELKYQNDGIKMMAISVLKYSYYYWN